MNAASPFRNCISARLRVSRAPPGKEEFRIDTAQRDEWLVWGGKDEREVEVDRFADGFGVG